MEADDGLYQALWSFRTRQRAFQRFSEEHCRAHGATPAVYQLLLALRSGPTRDRDIGSVANALGLRHHSAAELVHRAADAGFVIEKPDPLDRRRTLVRLTDNGEAVLARLAQGHADELRRIRGATVEILWAV